MKRRSFLAALGLAPVAAIAAKAGTSTETPNEHLAKTCADIDIGDISSMVTECTDWIGAETRGIIVRADQFVIR